MSATKSKTTADTTPAKGETGYKNILVAREDQITTITMNTPEKRNALSLETMNELIAAFTAAGRDNDTRVVILAANGPAFSAGHDLRDLVDGDITVYRHVFDVCVQLMELIQAIPQPVIARVHRIATAAGCQLVATCDLAIASDEAKFATPGVRIGLFCTTPMVALSRAVGRKRAMQMLLTGEAISAATAADWGLVNTVVPADQLEDATTALAAAHRRGQLVRRRARQTGFLHADRPRPAQGLRLRQRGHEHERARRRCAGGYVRLPR